MADNSDKDETAALREQLASLNAGLARVAAACEEIATTVPTPPAPASGPIDIERRHLALRAALGLEPRRGIGLLSGLWCDGALRGLTCSDPAQTLDGIHVHAFQGSAQEGGTLTDGVWTPKKLLPGRRLDRLELRATASGDPVAVGGPLAPVPTRCGD